MRRILIIWLPNWPVQRLVSDRPELVDKIVILHRDMRHGRQVATCSQAAAELGVRPRMPLVEAAAVVQAHGNRPGSPHLEPYDPCADRHGLEELARWCCQYSPCVGLEDADPPETLLLDVTGVAPLFAGELSLTEQVARGLSRLRLTGRIGLADTVGAAWAVAHYSPGGDAGGEPHIVPAGEDEAALVQLPTAALRLPSQMVETLDCLGLERIGPLLSIPRVELQARFAPVLLTRLDQARGLAAEVIHPVEPPSDFSAEWLLKHPATRLEVIHQVIEQLIGRLAHRLADTGQGALRLVCRLSCPPAPAVQLETSMFRPSANPRHLWELIQMRTERLRLPAPVDAVQLRVTAHAPLVCRQQGLFDQGQRQSDSPRVASLVDRLAARLGRSAVVRCVLKSDAQPEMAYRLEPVVDRASRRNRRQAAGPPLLPLDRPLHLLPSPVAIQTVAVAPEGPPVRFGYRGRDYQVARHWGPERIETGWWRRRGVRRDYYRVETKTGHRFWLFRQLQSGDWFMQGVFD